MFSLPLTKDDLGRRNFMVPPQTQQNLDTNVCFIYHPVSPVSCIHDPGTKRYPLSLINRPHCIGMWIRKEGGARRINLPLKNVWNTEWLIGEGRGIEGSCREREYWSSCVLIHLEIWMNSWHWGRNSAGLEQWASKKVFLQPLSDCVTIRFLDLLVFVNVLPVPYAIFSWLFVPCPMVVTKSDKACTEKLKMKLGQDIFLLISAETLQLLVVFDVPLCLILIRNCSKWT